MRLVKLIFAFLMMYFGSLAAASATVQIRVDMSTQRMHVESSNGSYDWPVSTARAGYATPRGHFSPTGLQRMHFSRKYHMSPMPHSIFFNGGYAIHGTNAVGALGRPASHGCVRLSPANAAQLYQMVQREGASISITGASPSSVRYAAHRAPRTHFAANQHRHRAHFAGYRPYNSHALGYAPTRHTHHGVKHWQRDPLAF
jgi:hypothetical protein